MMHGTINIKLTAYSCICWLFHRIYYDARNHKHEILINSIWNKEEWSEEWEESTRL